MSKSKSNDPQQAATLALQREALIFYDADYGHAATHHAFIPEVDLNGDTLALFLWRELGDAQGDRAEAIRMLETAGHQLLGVAIKLEENTL